MFKMDNARKDEAGRGFAFKFEGDQGDGEVPEPVSWNSMIQYLIMAGR